MRSRPLQLHRLLITACLALVQLFVPMVHAHTGDSHQAGVHMHIPGAGQDSDTPALSADSGIEIGIEPIRRESASLSPDPDITPLPISVPGTSAIAASGAPTVVAALNPTASPGPDANPPRGPPASIPR